MKTSEELSPYYLPQLSACRCWHKEKISLSIGIGVPFSHQVNASAARRVDLPHTWNAQMRSGGKHDYKRGIGNYTKKIFIRPEWQGKRLFYVFEGRIA